MAAQSINPTCNANQNNATYGKNMYLLMESLGRAKLAKRHEQYEHGSHGQKTAASQFENYSVRMCRRELLHQQNYSLSFSSFATNIETTHNTGGPINQPNLSCQLKQWQKRQEPVLRGWRTLALQNMQANMNNMKRTPGKQLPATSQFENYLARICKRYPLHRQNYSLKVVILRQAPHILHTSCWKGGSSMKQLQLQALHLQCKCKHEGRRPIMMESGRISVWKLQCSHVQKKKTCINKTTLCHCHPATLFSSL